MNKIIDAANRGDRTDLSFKVTKRPHTAKSDPLAIYPFRLRSNWAKVDGEGWTAKAIQIDPKTGRNVSGASLVDVYSATGGAPPEGSAFSWLFYAMWSEERERWESLQQPQNKVTTVAGKYTSVYDDSGASGAVRVVDNEGVWFIKIPGVDYQETRGTYFDNKYFSWIPSTLDIIDKKEVTLRAHYETVVVGIVDGVPTTKRVLVLGDS